MAFWRPAVLNLIAALLLVGVPFLSPTLARLGGERGERLVARLNGGELRRDVDDGTAGYYEALLDNGQSLSGTGGAVLLDWLPWFDHLSPKVSTSHVEQRDDFLVYDFAPNVATATLSTNSFGMPDREYAMHKPAHTRRIVVLGDSLSRGLGAEDGHSWEYHLENFLNESVASSTSTTYEVLNMSVDGYSITQLVDLQVEQASRFEPDVYLVALSDRMTSGLSWSSHLGTLLKNGRDLKYAPLIELATREKLVSGQRTTYYDARLAKYRLQVIGWALTSMRDQAASRNAQLVVALVPGVLNWSPNEQPFDGIDPLLDEIGVAKVDVRDAFTAEPSIEPYRATMLKGHDPHPNSAGYQLLFSRMRTRLEADEAVFSRIRGW